MRSLLAVLHLIRWQNCLIAMLVVVCGVFLLPELPQIKSIVLAGLLVALVTAFGNIHNDLIDLESDRINHPGRPLVSGAISKRSAVLIAVFAVILTVPMATLLDTRCRLIVLLALLMLYLYNTRIKRIPLLANLWVAVISMLAFVLAGCLLPSFKVFELNLVTSGAVFAFLLHTGREIVKDLQDVAGDRKHNIKTLANSAGARLSKAIVSVCFTGVIVFAIIIWLKLKPGIAFGVSFLIGIVIPLMVLVLILWNHNSVRTYRMISIVLKILMPVGLLALILARV